MAALDKRRYPRLRLSDALSVGPGLIAWCPVLRDADSKTLKRIIVLCEKEPRTRAEDDDA